MPEVATRVLLAWLGQIVSGTVSDTANSSLEVGSGIIFECLLIFKDNLIIVNIVKVRVMQFCIYDGTIFIIYGASLHFIANKVIRKCFAIGFAQKRLNSVLTHSSYVSFVLIYQLVLFFNDSHCTQSDCCATLLISWGYSWHQLTRHKHIRHLVLLN